MGQQGSAHRCRPSQARPALHECGSRTRTKDKPNLVVGEARAEAAQRVGGADEHGVADLARRLDGLLHARGCVVGRGEAERGSRNEEESGLSRLVSTQTQRHACLPEALRHVPG